jgi:signal transduction histidine kinase
VYRIAQEALANAARHAPYARTTLRLEVTNRGVSVVAQTSGPVLAPAVSEPERRPHFGLLGMQERAAALGGEFAAGPTADGWRVSCQLPLEERGSRSA